MICPQCGSEYVEGVTECADCKVALVAPSSAGDDARSDVDLQVVLTAGRADILALAKSMLQSAAIEFCVTGEEVQDLFGYGRFPGGFNVAMGPVRILVRHEDAADARALLAGLQEAAPVPATAEDESGEPPVRVLSTDARRLARLGAAVVLAFVAIELIYAVVTSWLGR